MDTPSENVPTQKVNKSKCAAKAAGVLLTIIFVIAAGILGFYIGKAGTMDANEVSIPTQIVESEEHSTKHDLKPADETSNKTISNAQSNYISTIENANYLAVTKGEVKFELPIEKGWYIEQNDSRYTYMSGAAFMGIEVDIAKKDGDFDKEAFLESRGLVNSKYVKLGKETEFKIPTIVPDTENPQFNPYEPDLFVTSMEGTTITELTINTITGAPAKLLETTEYFILVSTIKGCEGNECVKPNEEQIEKLTTLLVDVVDTISLNR